MGKELSFQRLMATASWCMPSYHVSFDLECTYMMKNSPVSTNIDMTSTHIILTLKLPTMYMAPTSNTTY